MTCSGPGDCRCGCCTGVHVETPRTATNPPGQSEIEFRTGTHGEFLSTMLARLSSPAYPALAGLTVRSADDPAIALLDGWAVVADLLTFHSERIANEGYLRTATREQTLRRLGRLVGHVPRPGVAASTFLAFTLDRDPTAGADTGVTIPRGARSQSVPGQGEEPQSFEIGEDLPARFSWNDLRVRQRRPFQVALGALGSGGQIYLAGTANDVKLGDRLLFVFGTERGRQSLQVVPHVDIDQQSGITVVGMAGQPPADFQGLAAQLRGLVAAARDSDTFKRSRIVQRFINDVLGPIAGALPVPGGPAPTGPITTPTELGRRLDGALERLAEAIALAQQYENVHGYLVGLLATLKALRAAVAQLEPPQPEVAAPSLHSALRLDLAAGGDQPGTPATLGLSALLPALRALPAQPPASPLDLARDPQQVFAPGSDISVQLLTLLDTRLRELYGSWQNVDLTEPQELQQLQALRTVATPFGAIAPLKPQFDSQGRQTGSVDWPLVGTQTLDLRVDFSDNENTPEHATFTWTESGRTSLTDTGLTTLPQDTTHVDIGPGGVDITVERSGGRPGHGPVSDVIFAFSGNLPHRRVTVTARDSAGVVTITVADGQSESFRLRYGESASGPQDGLEVSVRRAAPTSQTNAFVEVSLQTSLALSSRNVIALDAQYDGIGPGSWVVIQRPRKGQQGGVPGDPGLGQVITRVVGTRVVSRADFGITGKVTELTLAANWLDDQDTMLSDIRDATAYTRGDPLQLATEPVADDVSGGEIELAQLYQGLTPGRLIVVTGERTDIPNTPGVTGTELTMIGAVRQTVDPARPGDTVHTSITLATPLSFTYRRDTVHVYANVGAATQGASRDEPIGSGDASQSNQTFTLFGHPLTWLAADTPLGARSTLEIRVDGVLWSEVDSLAGRGPDEKVYVAMVDETGAVSVTFGDGIHGARLPTGPQNVRASYRVGIGEAGNVPASKITQLLTRPLWVSGVTNPLPATGGANPDDASQARRSIPLSVTALDRLVSVPDYEDFARARAGIGRASARRLSDGDREVVHVTVAGVDDVPLAGDSGVLRALRASLAELGDPQLPVAAAVRELVLLIVSARIRVTADHTWRLVEPAVRAALLDRLGFSRRELGQPAFLSEAIVAAQAVPGVDFVDVDVFAGVPGSLTPAELDRLAATLTTPNPVVPARLATFDEKRYTVPDGPDQTLTQVAAANGITVAELLRLNPDITTADPLPAGRSVVVFRGIRPAQLVLLSPAVPDTLILKEIR